MSVFQSGMSMSVDGGDLVEITHIQNSPGKDFIILEAWKGSDQAKLQMTQTQLHTLIIYLFQNRSYFGL